MKDIETHLKPCVSCCGSGSDIYDGTDCLDCCGTGFVPYGTLEGREISAEEYIEMVRREFYA